MDLRYGPDLEAFRAEVRTFVATWPARGSHSAAGFDAEVARFRAQAIERGYVYRTIARTYGGAGLSPDPLRQLIVSQEFSRGGVARGLIDARGSMLVHTLVDHGTQAQRERFIGSTMRGEHLWCQGYSEPGAGSDLASLRSSARLDGDHWVIEGHKIWTSGALGCDWMFGLFRTEPAAGKHAGISYLLIPMDQPGIEVRPLKQLHGSMDFNEVFFDGARTPADLIVGRRGEGWKVSRSTLKYERGIIGSPTSVRDQFDALLELARRSSLRGRPAIQDAGIRQRLVEIESKVRCSETLSLRQLSASVGGKEGEAGLAPLISKLYGTQLAERLSELAYDLIGSQGLLAPLGEDLDLATRGSGPRSWTVRYLDSVAHSIAGGASNIQRNIIGERGLGLPRDLTAPAQPSKSHTRRAV